VCVCGERVYAFLFCACSQCMEVLGKEKFDKVQRYCERNGVPEMRYCTTVLFVAHHTQAV